MVYVACIDIDDIKTGNDALIVVKQLVRACCEISKVTPMRERKALSQKMESLRKVCFVEGWKDALTEMKKGFVILKSVRQSENSMMNELFDIT